MCFRSLTKPRAKTVGLVEVWDESDPPVHPYIWMTVDPDLEDQGLEDFLLEWAEGNAFRARVFPINPGETRKITMRYTQVLERAGDALQFRDAAGGRFAKEQRGAAGRKS